VLYSHKNETIDVITSKKTHFVFSKVLFENRAVYGIILKNIVAWGMPQLTIWRMRTACWINKATNTQSQVV